LVLTLFAVLICVLLFTRAHPNEPIYDGKPLSYWLDQAAQPKGNDDEERAKRAIREIGTNALPYLEENLFYLPSDFLMNAAGIDRTYLRGTFHLTQVMRRPCRRAETGFEALGPAASNSVPHIIGYLHSEAAKGLRLSSWIERALDSVGDPAIAFLIPEIAATNALVANQALDTLSRMKVPLPASVTTYCLTALGRPELRVDAVGTLSRMTNDAKVILPAIRPFLADTNEAVRRVAVWAFRCFGSNALTYLPEIKSAMNDPSPIVRARAKRTLEQLTPPN
jgi:hypothetical protein